MGSYAFKLPDIGEGVVEGEIVKWHVSPGETVAEDQLLVDVMTDKATVTIPSSVVGTVTSITGEPGEMVPVGSVLIVFEIEGEGNVSAEAAAAEPEPAPEAPAVEAPAPAASPTAVTPAPTASPTAVAPVERSGRPLASPAVRRRARESGIDLAHVAGSGPAGRIGHPDLDAFIAGGGRLSGGGGASRIQRTDTTEVPVIGLRRKIAESMTNSYTRIPHFSYLEEIDVTELEELRQWLNSGRTEGQPKLTFLPFIMQALVRAMPSHPECNAHHHDEEGRVIRHGAVHLGIATQTERGLYVPVVKHVEAMDLWESASEMQRVTSAARSNTASLDDLTGSTFTITSLGRDGGLGATPIINHPEVGIMGVHRAREMPVVRDDRIVVRRIMNVSSSFDHRVVDGADGAALIQTLKEMLEHPATIFL